MGDVCGCGSDQPRASGAQGQEQVPERLWEVSELRFAAVSGVLLAASLIVGWVGGAAPLELGLQAAALAAGAWTFVPSTLRRLGTRRIGVGTLMTIAAVGAVALGEVGEAAMLAFLFSISEGLEEYSLARTRRGLRALFSLVPAQATVLREGAEQVVAPAELGVGEVMLIRPGEAVFAGSINGSGALEVEVTSTARENSLARMVRIVEAEQARKGAAQRLADRIARPLVPGVLIVAVGIAVLGSLLGDPRVWIEHALVVLVAASPCALAISIPVTVVAAVGAASKLGVLVKGGAALATADLGIAMGAMSTDVAIETADVALMGEDLRHLPPSARPRPPSPHHHAAERRAVAGHRHRPGAAGVVRSARPGCRGGRARTGRDRRHRQRRPRPAAPGHGR